MNWLLYCQMKINIYIIIEFIDTLAIYNYLIIFFQFNFEKQNLY